MFQPFILLKNICEILFLACFLHILVHFIKNANSLLWSKQESYKNLNVKSSLKIQ